MFLTDELIEIAKNLAHAINGDPWVMLLDKNNQLRVVNSLGGRPFKRVTSQLMTDLSTIRTLFPRLLRSYLAEKRLNEQFYSTASDLEEIFLAVRDLEEFSEWSKKGLALVEEMRKLQANK